MAESSGEASEGLEDLGPVQGIWIDGKRYEYAAHTTGLRKGTLHTIIGDFGNLEELIRYVRGREGTQIY